jgi:membrane glycosyltransferase
MDQIHKSEIGASSIDADEAKLKGRRTVVVLLNLASMAGLAFAMSALLGSRGWSVPTAAFMIIYLIGLPWTLLGFWNSVIGFVILRLVKDPVAYTNPALRITPPDSPIVTRTAICLAVRNEDAEATFRRLSIMIESLKATGQDRHFDVHILSDTSDAKIGALEESLALRLQVRFPGVAIRYRRRRVNTGYKAGNLEEFAARCRDQYQHMIVLDADSVMSGRAMLRLVRAMQANPKLGILQTLVVGRPAESGFTRIFQFGMRHGMRAQTTGGAWWQGSAGPYWGHNAIIRIAPFVDHCHLPTLPGKAPMGGWVLSHDQVEAALMRGAGWDVRVVPDEMQSWEENPTNLPDFLTRDLRWCQGNLQYLGLLTMPGLKPMGRFQLVNAIMMYAGAPMNLLMLVAGLSIALTPNHPDFATRMAFGLYAAALILGFAPRFLGVLDILLSGQARRYGGSGRMLAGCLLDMAFTLLIGPIMTIAQTVFIGGLCFGRKVIWEAQNRADRSVTLKEAVRGLWPQLAFGLLTIVILALTLPAAITWASLTIVPCLLAIPFACVTSGRGFSRLLVKTRLCAIPDELAPAWELLGEEARPPRVAGLSASQPHTAEP